jgi:hypothetical protein
MENGVINIIFVVLTVVCVFIYIMWRDSRKMNADVQRMTQQHNLVEHNQRARALCRAIHLLNPHVISGVDYLIKHDSPDQEPYIAEWFSDDSRPSREEIKSALLEISDVDHEAKYSALRRAEYPSVEEQLDAAYQARQGDDSKQREVDEKIRLVKEKYPKTDECV